MSNEESQGTESPIDSSEAPSPIPLEPPVVAADLTETPPSVPPTSSWADWVREGLRAGVLLPIRRLPVGPTAAQMLVIWVVGSLIRIGVERFTIDGDVQFDFTSWLYRWILFGIEVAGVWLILTWRSTTSRTATPVAAWMLLTLIAGEPINIVFALALVALRPGASGWGTISLWIYWTAFAAVSIWMLVTVFRVARAINHSKLVTAMLLVFVIGLTALQVRFLNFQVWQTDYSAETKDADEPAMLSLSQEVFESQQAILETSLESLKQHEGERRQIYGVIYAPYQQDVFLRESAMVQEVLEQNFDAKGRTVRMLNHPSVTETIPWATALNLERSLHAVAEAMDKERDVLVLYLTSHGGSDFELSSMYYPLETEGLKAAELVEMLDSEAIRNRVIIVSACYSGGWIEPLSNENTLVMTAADKDHTSYGCGNKSDLTYFGKALFDEQLRKTQSFEDAFNAAVPVIRQREEAVGKDDGFSNPQMSVGEKIKDVLADWAKSRQ